MQKAWKMSISHSWSITSQAKDQQVLIDELQNELKNVNGQTEGQKVLIGQMKTKLEMAMQHLEESKQELMAEKQLFEKKIDELKKDFDGKLEVRSSTLEHTMFKLDEKMDGTDTELKNLKNNITQVKAQNRGQSEVICDAEWPQPQTTLVSWKKLDGKMDTASTTVEGLGTSMDEKFQSLVQKIKLHQSGEYLTVEALEQVKFYLMFYFTW